MAVGGVGSGKKGEKNVRRFISRSRFGSRSDRIKTITTSIRLPVIGESRTSFAHIYSIEGEKKCEKSVKENECKIKKIEKLFVVVGEDIKVKSKQ